MCSLCHSRNVSIRRLGLIKTSSTACSANHSSCARSDEIQCLALQPPASAARTFSRSVIHEGLQLRGTKAGESSHPGTAVYLFSFAGCPLYLSFSLCGCLSPTDKRILSLQSQVLDGSRGAKPNTPTPHCRSLKGPTKPKLQTGTKRLREMDGQGVDNDFGVKSAVVPRPGAPPQLEMTPGQIISKLEIQPLTLFNGLPLLLLRLLVKHFDCSSLIDTPEIGVTVPFLALPVGAITGTPPFAASGPVLRALHRPTISYNYY